MRKYSVYRERDNRLINKLAFVFKMMSYDFLGIFSRTYLFTKKDFESEEERKGKEGGGEKKERKIEIEERLGM